MEIHPDLRSAPNMALMTPETSVERFERLQNMIESGACSSTLFEDYLNVGLQLWDYRIKSLAHSRDYQAIEKAAANAALFQVTRVGNMQDKQDFCRYMAQIRFKEVSEPELVANGETTDKGYTAYQCWMSLAESLESSLIV